MAGSRRQYPFHLIEPKWQQTWEQQQAFRAFNPGDSVPADHPFGVRHGLSGKVAATQLPAKFYILDMFPYPSGAGLHVGHPEGYTATDILARYRRACGFNVLHPMGWDSFGLPAEQYAVKTGQHPRVTTETNIANFTRQIKSLGFSYDWSRELATTDVEYFKWTQWIFLKLYNSWFNPETNKAEPVETLKYPEDLIAQAQRNEFIGGVGEKRGDTQLKDFAKLSSEIVEMLKRQYRDSKRLAYVSEAPVNWCPELGTVLANEEVIDGKSEVGGFPVIRKPMRQWMLRITAYAEKLLTDLDTIDWSDSLKEMQRNWIGRSEGATVKFEVDFPGGTRLSLDVFTTRPDTLFGATYMVVAPEHWLIDLFLMAAEQKLRINTEITSPSVRISNNGHAETLALADALSKAEADGVDLIEVNPILYPPACVLRNYKEYRSYQQAVLMQVQSIEDYRKQVAGKSDLERTELAKEKTGVFTGVYAINPVNGEKIPIWIADYVLASYGTGAIMAVPAHDERDFEFAKKFNLQIRAVVMPPDQWLKENRANVPAPEHDWSQFRSVYLKDAGFFAAAFPDMGNGVNSANADVSLNGLSTAEAKKKITAWLEEKGFGKKTINYKLRDWLFSRQRYWGEPFPIIWKKDAAVPQGGMYHEALPESSLPLLPPSLEDYKPTPDGQPPLARAKDWLNLPDGSVRETNTMPQWAGSCWYYLRYLDSKNTSAFVGKDAENYWMGVNGCKLKIEGCKLDTAAPEPATFNQQPATPGVDLYVGGTEHAVLHLLYARFWHKVLFDLGYVSTPEPFFKLVNQGLILGSDGQKMSKSRGNVVNPDDVLTEFGADAFRLYEMFMGPLQDTKPWNTRGVEGVYRFLGRVWRLFVDEQSETEFEQAETTANAQAPEAPNELLSLIKLHAAIKNVEPTPVQLKTLHACIKKVTEDLDGMRFNTAISAMMVFINDAMTWETKPVSVLKTFLQLLAPFAPHLAEELWAKLATFNLQPSTSLAYSPWPKFDPALLVESEIEIPVSVNGKMRDVIKVAADADNATLEATAKSSEKVKQFIDGKTIKKVIIVPKRMVNIIVT